MGELLAKRDKKEVVKDIILRLHRGLSLEEAKRTFEEEVGSISSTEIAEIEQSLMNEGLSPEEIKNSVTFTPYFSSQPWRSRSPKRRRRYIL